VSNGILVGGVLVTGFVVFMTGAVAWRPEYDRPLAESLTVIHTDHRRRRWIHVWMLLAMLITPAGVAGLAVLPGTDAFVLITIMAAVVYGIGSVCWVVSLAFRLTVMPWAAEQAERTDEPAGRFRRAGRVGDLAVHDPHGRFLRSVRRSGCGRTCLRHVSPVVGVGRGRLGRGVPQRICGDRVHWPIQPAVLGALLPADDRRGAVSHIATGAKRNRP